MKQRKNYKYWIRYILTPGDNNEWDIGYVVWFIMCVVYILAGFLRINTLDFTSYAGGAAGLLVAGAGLQWHANRKDMNGSLPPT